MGHSHGIFLFDLSMIIFMLVFAYLSNRLGEALRVPAYYKILFGTSGIVAGSLILDGLSSVTAMPGFSMVAMYIRFFAGVVSCAVVFRYWMWVFSEFFRH